RPAARGRRRRPAPGERVTMRAAVIVDPATTDVPALLVVRAPKSLAWGDEPSEEYEMSTASRVPETITISGDELSADDAVTTLRRYGRWKLVKHSFIRFRYADGFTNARALALQFCLSFIPLIIAVVGLSSALHHEKFGQVGTRTLARGMPAANAGNVMQEAAQHGRDQGATGGHLALWLGLLA